MDTGAESLLYLAGLFVFLCGVVFLVAVGWPEYGYHPLVSISPALNPVETAANDFIEKAIANSPGQDSYRIGKIEGVANK